MKIHASSAIENGLISQFTPTVEAMPRQCCPTSRSAAGSIFSSIGTIISQTSTATGMLTCATVASPMTWKTAGIICPSAMPAMMQSATHRVRKRSKRFMAGFDAGVCGDGG